MGEDSDHAIFLSAEEEAEATPFSVFEGVPFTSIEFVVDTAAGAVVVVVGVEDD